MTKTCFICGKEITGNHYNSEGRFTCSNECFRTLYWNDVIAEKEKHIVVNGTCALIEPDTKKGIAGCYGREFKFRNLTTGEIVTTHNLWIQGEIPASHRMWLPDTHEEVR